MVFGARRVTRGANHDLPAPGPAEREWVERVRTGDETAFEAMFSAYYPALCDFAEGYVHSPESAEEIVQNVFLRIWERHAMWEPAHGVRAYLFAACRNQALDYCRHERVVARLGDLATREDVVTTVGQSAPPPDEQLQTSELAAALHRAVHELPERRRLVVMLRWQHQLSHAEIARVLGISVKGVETQFARAIVTLRRRLAIFGR